MPTLNDEARLAAALAPLVPAAVDGLIKELILADGGSTDRTFDIADDAGARFLRLNDEPQARIEEAVKGAKGEWLLLLDPCVRLEFGWEAAALKHMQRGLRPGRFRLRRTQGGLFSGVIEPKALAMLTPRQQAVRTRAGVRRLEAFGWVD